MPAVAGMFVWIDLRCASRTCCQLSTVDVTCHSTSTSLHKYFTHMPCCPSCRSRWLPESTWEAERAFWDRVCQEGKIILTPGHDCHAPKPGFFRLCFAWMPPEALAVAMGRLQRVLAGMVTDGARR